jgi:hypothetical protein
MLDQRGGRQIPEDLGTCCNALSLQSAVRNALTHLETILPMVKAAALPFGRRIRMHERAYNPENLAWSKQHSVSNHRRAGAIALTLSRFCTFGASIAKKGRALCATVPLAIPAPSIG